MDSGRSTYRAFTASPGGAFLHGVAGAALGVVAPVVLYLAAWGMLEAGDGTMLILLAPVMPIALYTALDAAMNQTRGCLLRGAIAGIVALTGAIGAFALSKDHSGDDTAVWVLCGICAGAAGVALSRVIVRMT